jgi:type I restriction enzyme M protein
MENDTKMVLLSELNMLLNGDGNANIAYVPENGALTQKFSDRGTIVALNEEYHRGGSWDRWMDQTRLLLVDVVLTNPPFGKGRSLDLSKESDKYAAGFYALYDEYVKENPKEGLDPGILFLENAVRSTKRGGRFGIVLSNSIASNKTWCFIREWLLRTVRVVALFDLPANVFAETGVNTTLVVGYNPRLRTVEDLIREDYAVFTREISHVGYEKRTSNELEFARPLRARRLG